ncbi:MAG: MBL fold metallo-hydrolase [Firmicutes bacterium]|nr:MBL fold metallo-hydrolase [Bacillota bacterium]
MEITLLTVGELAVNCYLVSQEDRAVVIDPGDDAEVILGVLEERSLKLEGIINTHGHFDHIGANGALKEATEAALYIHRGDAQCLQDAGANLSQWAGLGPVVSPPADELLSGGEVLQLAGLEFEVFHTPGHSPGCICLKVENVLFTGDTLFAGSVGRVDFPGSSWESLMKSLKEVILPLDPDTVIYPGHGPASTLRAEKEHNPFLTGRL